MTPGEHMEAAIWHAMRDYQVSSPWPAKFVDAVRRAAGHYATTVVGTATENGITAARRAVLAAAATAGRPLVHFGHNSRHACRLRRDDAGYAPPLTTDPAAVTCARCKHTRAYHQAQQEAAS